MGRLIDADALCERIREIYDGYMLDEGCTPIDFENMVDAQPTAYNVGAVLTELEEEAYNGFDITLSKATAIVKRGGVE